MFAINQLRPSPLDGGASHTLLSFAQEFLLKYGETSSRLSEGCHSLSLPAVSNHLCVSPDQSCGRVWLCGLYCPLLGAHPFAL